jgi:hypothetical protein
MEDLLCPIKLSFLLKRNILSHYWSICAINPVAQTRSRANAAAGARAASGRCSAQFKGDENDREHKRSRF